MARCLPDFLLLQGVYAGGRIALLVVPYGLDFYKDECASIAGDNVQFTAHVGVIAGDNLVAFAA